MVRLIMDPRRSGLEHINAKLKARGQLARFIEAIEADDRATVAKLLERVGEPDDGTIAGFYLSNSNVLAALRVLEQGGGRR